MQAENTHQPLVSIITPCYKQEEYLGETLASVLRQTYNNWECVIVSDGSPDNVKKIAEEFTAKDKRFIFYDTENGGPSVARNFGISKSHGEYILPLDGDDLISENYIEECLKVMSGSDDTKLVYATAEKIGIVNEKWILQPYSFNDLLFYTMIHSCGIYKKKCWENVGGYDVNMRQGCEDWEFWINILKDGGNVVKIDSAIFYWRRKEVSRTTQLDKIKLQKLHRYIYQKHADLYEYFFDDPLTLYSKYSHLKMHWDSAKKNPFRFFLSQIKKKFTTGK